MAQILLTLQADEDLEQIWAYIAQDNVTAADRLTDQFHETFDLLASTPDLGIPQFQYRDNLHCKPVAKRYLVFYEPLDDGIRVLRVLHGARDWPQLL